MLKQCEGIIKDGLCNTCYNRSSSTGNRCTQIYEVKQPSPVSLDTHTAEEKVEKIIVDWLKSDNENATYCAHLIVKAMTEFASQESRKARQDTLQKVKDLASKYYDGEMLKTVNKFLDTIKSDSTKPPYEK